MSVPLGLSMRPICVTHCFVFFYKDVHITCARSINAVGVDIASFSAMSDEAEVLLLPGLPLTNHPGENPEPELWTFEVETPHAPVDATPDVSPPVMIDYVHPGEPMGCLIRVILVNDKIHCTF